MTFLLFCTMTTPNFYDLLKKRHNQWASTVAEKRMRNLVTRRNRQKRKSNLYFRPRRGGCFKLVFGEKFWKVVFGTIRKPMKFCGSFILFKKNKFSDIKSLKLPCSQVHRRISHICSTLKRRINLNSRRPDWNRFPYFSIL